jgi:PAS domain S-box-containing protein
MSVLPRRPALPTKGKAVATPPRNARKGSAGGRLDPRATAELVDLLWDTPQAVTVQDARFRVVAANRAYCEAVGYPPAQLLGHDPVEHMPAAEKAAVLASRTELLRALQAGRQPDGSLDRCVHDANGRMRWFRSVPRWVSASDGSPLLLAILHDVTAEHVARAQADRSVHELEHWFDLSPIGMLVYDASGLIVRSNAAFEQLVGRAPVMLHDAPADLCELLAWERDRPHPALRADAPALEVRGSVSATDGRRLRLRARLRAFATDIGQVRVMAAIEDLSLEEERDLAQLEIGALMDTAGIGVATYEASRGWLRSRGRANPATVARPPTSAALQAIGRDQVDPESLEEFERLQQALREGRRAQARYAVHTPELGRRWLLTRVEPADLGGGRAALSVVTLDVTDQEDVHRRNEELLRELSTILSGTTAGILHVRHGRIERANDAMAALTDYSVEALQQMPLADLFETPESYGMLHTQQEQALRRDGLWRGERRLRCNGGRLVWVQVSKRCVADHDPDAGLICSYADIDELHRAREALQSQAERTRAILDSVLVGIVTVGEGGIEWMNRSARRMFGGELADFVGEPIATVATADADHPLRATHYLDGLEEGRAETFECRLRGRDGREFWVVGNAVLTGRGSSGRQVTFALLDIERRRQAEVSIAQAQASLQRIIETAPLAIALFDASSARVLRLNQMAAMFIGQPVEQVLGRPPGEWLQPDEARALLADLDQARQQPDGLRRELPLAHSAPGAEMRIWDVRIVPLESAGDAQLLLVASDVTEQRAAEQARFDAAVSQREMLVKEVHHRIKNNLQGVAGLLQQTAARRPEVAALIGEAVSQVQAIAQVHGLQVGISGPLRVKPLLEAITGSVQRTFGRPVQVRVEEAPGGLPAHRYALPEAESIPIALTINELLTNAIKHSESGAIGCVLRCEDAGVSITVTNPGRLREGFSLAQVPPGVSGLGLVRALLPRRTATLALQQVDDEVHARVALTAPGVTILEPL